MCDKCVKIQDIQCAIKLAISRKLYMLLMYVQLINLMSNVQCSCFKCRYWFSLPLL